MIGKIKKFYKIEGGNSGLTEDVIYLNQPFTKEDEISIYSSATQESNLLRRISKKAKIKGKTIKIFTGKGVIIARNGKAGSMIYLDDGKYTMNDHAYFVQIKDEYKDKINLKYLMFGFKTEVENAITSDKTGNRTFNKTIFEESIVEIPSIEEQDMLVKQYDKLISIKTFIETKIADIESNLKTIPKTDIGNYYKIEQVFNLVSENRKMTEEYIYNHQGKYPVYSAQIDGAYGYIDTYDYDGEILSVVSYGDSGKTTLRNGKLTIGRNACGLLPKKEYKDKVLLRFAKYALQDVFINNAKGSDLKSLSQTTINSTEFFLPNFEEQEIIANEYEKLENILEMLKKIDNKICKLIG